MRWLSLSILSALVASLAVAEPPLRVETAVATALEESPAVQAAEATATAAAERARQAAARRLPSLDLSESFSYSENPAEVFAMRLNQGRFNLEDFFGSDPNNPDWLDTWITRLEVTQPVYTGGKLGARINQADLMAAAEEAAAGHTREQVAYETVTAFTNLAKAREYRSLMSRARATTSEHVALAELYAEQGMIVSAEVLKARVHLAEMDELLAKADNGARLAEAALNFNMGVDQSTPHELAPLPPPPVPRGALDELVETALSERHDLNAARRQLEAGRLEERAARSPFLPEVAVLGRYDLYDDTPFGDNGSSGSIMAVARINLFRGGSDRAALAAARHDTLAGQHDIERFEEGIRLEVQQAWQDLESARTRQAAAAASLESASEALRVREQRFKQGLDRMIDLMDAETALRESEVRELVARYDLALAAFRLHFVSGQSVVDLLALEEN